MMLHSNIISPHFFYFSNFIGQERAHLFLCSSFACVFASKNSLLVFDGSKELLKLNKFKRAFRWNNPCSFFVFLPWSQAFFVHFLHLIYTQLSSCAFFFIPFRQRSECSRSATMTQWKIIILVFKFCVFLFRWNRSSFFYYIAFWGSNLHSIYTMYFW